MWISLIIALLTYLLQNPKNAEERKKALMIAGAAGLGTYAVTNYTDWGQQNLAPLNDSINGALGFGGSSTTAGAANGGVTGSPVIPGAATTTSSAGGWADGFWTTLQSWGGVGTAAVIGTAGVATGVAPSWFKWALIGGAAWFVLKD